MRKYNLFELVGIYTIGKGIVKIGKVVSDVLTEAFSMAKTRYYNEELSKANEQMSKAVETIKSLNTEDTSWDAKA